jgi:hypothetical protein
MDKRIHIAGFLGRDVVLGIEALHFTGEVHGKRGVIEFGDGGDAGLAGYQVGPAFGNRVSDRRHKAKPSDDDATTAHYVFLRVREEATERRISLPPRHGRGVQVRSILRLRTDESHRKQQGKAATARPPAFCGSEFRYDGLRP